MKYALLVCILFIVRGTLAAEPAPFEMRLVVAEAGDDTQTLTHKPYTDAAPESVHLKKRAFLDCDAVRHVTWTITKETGQPEIVLTFTEAGGKTLAKVTKAHLDEQLAILIHGKIAVVAGIRTEIRDGQAHITGRYTQDEAIAIVKSINKAVIKEQK
ncbi:MAG: hypothetical protein QM811_02180 [Pirellulales bacterium]